MDQQAKPTTRRVKKKRRKRTSSNDDTVKKALQQLKAKYAASSRGDDEVLEAIFNVNTKEISNPSSYDRIISRALDSQLNRLAQTEAPNDAVDSTWLCALCQKQSCWERLGDLYGPYFIELSDECQPPSVLLHTQAGSSKQKKRSVEHKAMDVWLHGQCALWAPELYLVAGRFPKLDEFLAKYWSQTCVECHKTGASIPLEDSLFIHYFCAAENGYRMKELTFRCEPPR